MIFDNIYDLVKDLRTHIKENDSFVIPYDEPAKLLVGYICDKTAKQWQIHIRNLRNDSSKYGELAKRSFASLEGKIEFAKFLNNKESLTNGKNVDNKDEINNFFDIINDLNVKIYDNFFDLVRDLKNYIEKNDSNVYPCDDLKNMQIGFICDKTDLRFIINYKILRDDVSKYGALIRSSFRSFDERMKLVQFLNDKKSIMTFEQLLEKEFSQDVTEYNPMFPRDKDQMKP